MTDPAASLRAFIDAVESGRSGYAGPLWYRGVGDGTAYKLIPSLYRHPDANGDMGRLRELEETLHSRFQQRALPFLRDPLGDDWEQMFLMQHHGVPTRLLDWSESPLVGLFFALTSAPRESGKVVENPAVWVLRPEQWNSEALSNLGSGEKIFTPAEDDMRSYAPVLTTNRPVPAAIYGVHNSPRIVAQRGVFTVFGANAAAMEDVRVEHGLPGEVLMKIEIAADAVDEMIADLAAYGITDSAMFPDLDGLAREMKRQNGF